MLCLLLVFGAVSCDRSSSSVSSGAVCVGNAGGAVGAGYELPSMLRNVKLQIDVGGFD